jgi:hypothetical protein
MDDVAWEMTYSVETEADAEFAWRYWSDVRNWDDPPAEFELDGEFVDGARGVTRVGGRDSMHWIVRDVRAGKAATIEIQLDGAVMTFHWRVEGTGERKTRLTQHAVLRGEKADKVVEQAKVLEETLPQGMKKLAEKIGEAARREGRG